MKKYIMQKVQIKHIIYSAIKQYMPRIQSNATILKLKKGQRVKDGMILMLSGQVDRRKQLLLGAQVFVSSYSVSEVIILAVFNVITFCCI